MNVLILGGGGEVGRHIVTAAERIHAISKITIGERDENRAHSVAGDCGDKVCVRCLDISDDVALTSALADCDAVVSCIGPYYKFGTHVLSAAIRAKRHYIDVCDDWEPTLEMLALDAGAQAAGISALVGMGASPGVSNLLAASAHGALDRVDALHTVWGTGDRSAPDAQEDDSASRAALEHWLQQVAGTIRVRENGAMGDVKPLQEHAIKFPQIGTVHCHSVGHPEPVTLPLAYPEVQDSLNLMNMPAPIINALRRTAKELDDGDVDMAQAVMRLEVRLGEGKSIRAILSEVWLHCAVVWDSLRGVKYAPQICAIAVGEKDGQPAQAGAWLDGYIPGGTGGMTGVPAAAALEMLVNGEITRRGVFAPERGLDPGQLFQYLRPHAIRPEASKNAPFLNVAVESG